MTTNAISDLSHQVDVDPRHLLGPLAPVPDEITARDLVVTGCIPIELDGRYFRNGPNPLPGQPSGHWFLGHGMVHGLGLRDGRATWYANRWVRTAALDLATGVRRHGPEDHLDLEINAANTHVIEHAGRLLALCESGLPYELTHDLDTVGSFDYDGRLTTAMTAHPKVDPTTGELFFFGYSPIAPFLTYHVSDAAGRLVHSEPVDVPGPTMMHDFAITEHYVVWLDLPVTFSMERWISSGGATMPYGWDDGYGARIGIMARSGGPVRWVEIDPCYVFHVGNAGEDATGAVVLDAVRYSATSFAASWSGIGGHAEGASAGTQQPSVLYRWRIDPRTGSVTEDQLDDRDVEFPSHNDVLTGRPSRYRYAVATDAGDELVKYDLDRGTSQTFRPAVTGVLGEAAFVPAVDASAEDDGWLLSLHTPEDGSASSLLIMDATDLAGGPVAAVHLPRRVPAGFHGSWVTR